MQPLLEVRGLCISFETENGSVCAVDGVSFDVRRGQTVALVGESGCGKSVTAMSLLRLLPPRTARIEGQARFLRRGSNPLVDLFVLPPRQMQAVRGGEIAMIFQEPGAALNPVMPIGDQIAEAAQLHLGLSLRQSREAACGLLRRVGLPAAERRMGEYPHQMSGGMLQRVMMAVALAGNPTLLIADEPTTALDVTVQRQVLDLLKELQTERGMGLLFITHDLGLVAHYADYVYVMYAGRIVEHAPTVSLFSTPLHPYTQGLLSCLPKLSTQGGSLPAIPGQVPMLGDFPLGCRFHPRCQRSKDRAGNQPSGLGMNPAPLPRCAGLMPEHQGGPELVGHNQDHFVACWEVP